MKKKPAELREQARRLLQEAERLERERMARIGKLVADMAAKELEGMSPEGLKARIRQIIEEA